MPDGNGEGWTWPATPVALGEALAAAALRALASAGLAARPGTPLPPLERISRHADGRLAAHRVLFPVRCHTPTGGPGHGRWLEPGTPGLAGLVDELLRTPPGTA